MTREEFQDEMEKGMVSTGYQKESDGPFEKFTVRWVTGCATGGNCWDESESSYDNSYNQPEPEFEILDDKLSIIAPSLTFMQYKKLMTNVVYSEKTDYEYYGNFTEYTTKQIILDDIWNFLVECDLV